MGKEIILLSQERGLSSTDWNAITDGANGIRIGFFYLTVPIGSYFNGFKKPTIFGIPKMVHIYWNI
jgi:hypothetical protein